MPEKQSVRNRGGRSDLMCRGRGGRREGGRCRKKNVNAQKNKHINIKKTQHLFVYISLMIYNVLYEIGRDFFMHIYRLKRSAHSLSCLFCLTSPVFPPKPSISSYTTLLLLEYRYGFFDVLVLVRKMLSSLELAACLYLCVFSLKILIDSSIGT